MKVRDLLKDGEQKLAEAGVPNAAFDARLLLEEAYGKSSAELLAELDRELCPGATGSPEPAGGQACPGDCGAMLTYRMNLSQRARRIPLQQILGHTGFMGLDFKVNRHVLIPRPDTEVLAETVLEREKDPEIRLLDLCTGSGCLAVSLKHYGNYKEVTASDIDKEALYVAMRNASIHKAEIRAVLSDLYEALEGPFDVIVSNPPYIPSEEIDTLEPEVRDHDPRIALDGGGDGLEFYRRIIRGAGRMLVPGGRIYLEIGWNQAEDVCRLLKEQGAEEIEVIRDLAGQNRTVRGRMPG